MKYVVTGATSGLGRNLAERLRINGHQVTGFGRNVGVGHILRKQGIEFSATDLKQTEKMTEVMRDADAVFHCAALSSPWGKYKNFYEANVVGTENVIEAVKASKGKLLIHVSTPSIYFNYTSQYDLSENTPLPKKFSNHYAATKKIAEDRVIAATKSQAIRSTIIRPRGIIGPYDQNILPRILHISKRGFMPLIDGGEALVDITYVGNVVDAMILALKEGRHQSGQVFNITNDEPIALKDLLSLTLDELEIDIPFKRIPYFAAHLAACTMEAVCKILPSSPEPPLTSYSAGVFGLSQTLNIDAAKRDLGYTPQISIKDGIKKSAQWWRQNENRI